MIIWVKKNKTEWKTLIRNKKYIGIKCKENEKNKDEKKIRLLISKLRNWILKLEKEKVENEIKYKNKR